MSVEANMELGNCLDCPEDCMKCMNQGYCYYEKKQEDREKEEESSKK